ncbi:MAG: GtrA family protein [Oscillospiraceae bacterium]
MFKKLFERLNIQSREELWAFIKQFIKFGMVGLSNTAISLGVYYIFVCINKNLYMIGNFVGFVISVLSSFYWNNRFVFEKTQDGYLKPLLKTFISYGATFLLSSTLLFIMVNVLDISEMLAPILNLVITIPLNFILNKFWAFK